MTTPPAHPPLAAPGLVDRVRRALIARAAIGTPITYQALAAELGLAPPLTIHHLTEALEATMREDAAAGRPLIASLCIGKGPARLPGRGFFLAAAALGTYIGGTDGDDARQYHDRELADACSFYALSALMLAMTPDQPDQQDGQDPQC